MIRMKKRKLLIPSGLILLLGLLWHRCYFREVKLQEKKFLEDKLNRIKSPEANVENEKIPEEKPPKVKSLEVKLSEMKPPEVKPQNQKPSQEKKRDEITKAGKKAKKKNSIHSGHRLQRVVNTNSKRGLNMQLLISAIWLGFIVWMIIEGVQTLVPWLIWLGVGAFNFLLGIIFYAIRKI